jgi:hypothetical protein
LFVGKREERRSLRRTRHRWENNIKIDQEDGTAWIGFIWLRIGAGLVNK